MRKLISALALPVLALLFVAWLATIFFLIKAYGSGDITSRWRLTDAAVHPPQVSITSSPVSVPSITTGTTRSEDDVFVVHKWRVDLDLWKKTDGTCYFTVDVPKYDAIVVDVSGPMCDDATKDEVRPVPKTSKVVPPVWAPDLDLTGCTAWPHTQDVVWQCPASSVTLERVAREGLPMVGGPTDTILVGHP